VPIGYLVTVLVLAWCTSFALVPLRRPWALGRLSWVSAFLLNELPFVAGFWLLASTLLAAGQGDLDSPVGGVALGIAVLTAGGLLVVTWRGMRTGQATGRALTEGLGAGWRATLDADLAAGLRRRRPLARILFAPYLMRRRDVERVANLRYGDAGVRNLLDVYRPRERASSGPALVYFHGGGFTSGRKNREGRPLLYRLASQGWVCVSANYRLGPVAAFPDHLVDAKKVIAWVREHGHEHGADPSVMFVAGSSAGAHLAATAALTADDSAFQPGFEQADTSVSGAICLYGYYGPLTTDDPRPSAPSAYADAGAPPFLVAHGDQDTFALVDGARAFVKTLRSRSTQPVVYAELPGGQHSFDLFHSLRFEAVVDAVEAFTAWVLSHGGGRSPDDPSPGPTTDQAGQASQ
jgi:acetyl esterase/lipase